MAYGIWHKAYGIKHMAYGIWHMAYGIWHMAYGTWRRLVPYPISPLALNVLPPPPPQICVLIVSRIRISRLEFLAQV